MEERDPGELSDRVAREADGLQHRSEALQQDVSEARQDWERKRADDGVPGANPPEGEADGEDSPASEGSGAGDDQTASDAGEDQTGE